MAPCTHPGVTCFSVYRGKTASIPSFPRPCFTTSRGVHEARCGLALAAGRLRWKEKNEHKRKKSAPPETHHEIHSHPVTATNSRRHARKHVPRVTLHSPAPIDHGCVKICLVQLSRSIKPTNVTHTQDTDRLITLWHPVHTPV